MSKSAFRQAFNLLCHEVIGRGMSRTVYSSLLLPGSVIKVEPTGGHFQNVVEWETWQAAQNLPAARWLARCQWISSNGEILVMERTRPAAPQEVPKRLPAFITDFKLSNFGMAPSRRKSGARGPDWFVCHDYGTNLAIDRGLAGKAMRAHSLITEDS